MPWGSTGVRSHRLHFRIWTPELVSGDGQDMEEAARNGENDRLTPDDQQALTPGALGAIKSARLHASAGWLLNERARVDLAVDLAARRRLGASPDGFVQIYELK